jgi:4-alpha-glucanotransferase
LPWTAWPEPLARTDAAALAEARASLRSEITYREYLQWIAAEQWADAKRLSWPVRVFGDLPFMISGDSPDVWARQREFRFDATIGVPPDAFSETGQDWGLPPWRAGVMAENGFTWMHARGRRYGDLYDGFRIDHLVGLYRMYVRPIDKTVPAFFEPAEEEAQISLGETLIGILAGTGQLDSIARLIDVDHGGQIVKRYLTELRIARRVR